MCELVGSTAILLSSENLCAKNATTLSLGLESEADMDSFCERVLPEL